jgi:hypothetical protein
MTPKETAVEWLFFEMKGTKWINADWEKRRLIIEQAKAMEKEQIIIAYQSERYPCSDSDAEQYYNETYGIKD